MTSPAVVRVRHDHAVAEILTDAFAHDPFMAWVFADPATRSDSLAVWWSWLVRHLPVGAELWRTDDAASGAIWYPPRFLDTPDGTTADDPDAEEGAPSAFVEMLAPLVGERLDEVLEVFGTGSARHPAEPHWYLLALGTRHDRQGRGLGALVVGPVIERCDAQGLGIHLESSNPRNVPFYHRLGFEITGEFWTPDGTTPLTTMWRSPR